MIRGESTLISFLSSKYLRRVVDNICVADPEILEVAQELGGWSSEVARVYSSLNGSRLV